MMASTPTLSLTHIPLAVVVVVVCQLPRSVLEDLGLDVLLSAPQSRDAGTCAAKPSTLDDYRRLQRPPSAVQPHSAPAPAPAPSEMDAAPPSRNAEPEEATKLRQRQSPARPPRHPEASRTDGSARTGRRVGGTPPRAVVFPTRSDADRSLTGAGGVASGGRYGTDAQGEPLNRSLPASTVLGGAADPAATSGVRSTPSTPPRLFAGRYGHAASAGGDRPTAISTATSPMAPRNTGNGGDGGDGVGGSRTASMAALGTQTSPGLFDPRRLGGGSGQAGSHPAPPQPATAPEKDQPLGAGTDARSVATETPAALDGMAVIQVPVDALDALAQVLGERGDAVVAAGGGQGVGGEDQPPAAGAPHHRHHHRRYHHVRHHHHHHRHDPHDDGGDARDGATGRHEADGSDAVEREHHHHRHHRHRRRHHRGRRGSEHGRGPRGDRADHKQALALRPGDGSDAQGAWNRENEDEVAIEVAAAAARVERRRARGSSASMSGRLAGTGMDLRRLPPGLYFSLASASFPPTSMRAVAKIGIQLCNTSDQRMVSVAATILQSLQVCWLCFVLF